MDQKKQTTAQDIDDLVSMLDGFMENGGGHMNVKVENPQELSAIHVETFNTAYCSDNMACSVPTLHKGIDDEEE